MKTGLDGAPQSRGINKKPLPCRLVSLWIHQEKLMNHLESTQVTVQLTMLGQRKKNQF